MPLQSTDAASEAVIGATEETLDNLKAIKGEAFADCVLMGVNVKSLMSMNAALYGLIDESNAQARELAMMSGFLTASITSRILTLLAEKADVSDPADVIEWVERIHENANRIGNAAIKTSMPQPPSPDTLQ